MSPSPRVVLVTDDGLHGRRVLHALASRGLAVRVLYLVGDLGPPRRPGMALPARLLRWPRALARTVVRALRFHASRRARYAARSAGVTPTGALNGTRMQRDLRALAPDWILLGGGGIVSPEVIAAARCGVLNAHPALLPWVRGTGVVGASLVHGVALGATVHRVDAGIDTGPIVARRLLAVPSDARTLDALEQRVAELAAELLADVVEGTVRGSSAAGGVAQAARYPLFRWPDSAAARMQRALAAVGRAAELEAAWRPLCAGAAHGDLPPGALEAPAVTTLAPRPPRVTTS